MTTDRETRSASLSTECAARAHAADRLALPRTLLLRAALGGAFLLVALSVSLMLSSCGSSKKSGAQQAGGDAAEAAEQPISGIGTTPVTAATTPVVAEPIEGGWPVTAQPESLPPDIAVTVGDTLVVPGENVELLAQASVDVIGISLSDGLHNGIAFAYDGDARAWRTSYRVPLRPHGDRISLSVTAKNDVGRWCRHWVFLSVDRGTTTAPEEAR
jgi:hypothetical protein